MPTAQSPSRPPVPEHLGKYALLGLVGKGAMGVVYKSFDPHIRRPVALKTIRRDLLEEDDKGNFASRFRHEAQAAGALQHPGIVAVYEYGEDEQYAYIAMEFVEGSSLRQYFDQKVRFSPADTVSVLSQLLDALHYAHDRGVWHRDIKPGNIMIMSNGRIKITDFGIARIESSTLTQVGAILGTPGFIAPELYLGTEFDRRVDVFAAGVVLYQLLVGTAPFTGSPENVMYKVCYEEPVAPSVAARNPALQRYDAVVLRALAKRPEDRYASAGAFRDELMRAHEEAISPAVSEETIINNPAIMPLARAAQDAPAGARSVPSHASPGSASRAGTAPASTAGLAAAGWDVTELAHIEQHLARFIGPVAKVMVRRGASESPDGPALLHWLAEHLISPSDRAEFLKFGANARPAAVRPAATHPPAGADDATQPRGGPVTIQPTRHPAPADLALAARLLAPHLGPIAQVLVKRAAAQADVTRDKFLLSLAGNLPNEQERAKFLAAFGV